MKNSMTNIENCRSRLKLKGESVMQGVTSMMIDMAQKLYQLQLSIQAVVQETLLKREKQLEFKRTEIQNCYSNLVEICVEADKILKCRNRDVLEKSYLHLLSKYEAANTMLDAAEQVDIENLLAFEFQNNSKHFLSNTFAAKLQQFDTYQNVAEVDEFWVEFLDSKQSVDEGEKPLEVPVSNYMDDLQHQLKSQTVLNCTSKPVQEIQQENVFLKMKEKNSSKSKARSQADHETVRIREMDLYTHHLENISIGKDISCQSSDVIPPPPGFPSLKKPFPHCLYMAPGQNSNGQTIHANGPQVRNGVDAFQFEECVGSVSKPELNSFFEGSEAVPVSSSSVFAADPYKDIVQNLSMFAINDEKLDVREVNSERFRDEEDLDFVWESDDSEDFAQAEVNVDFNGSLLVPRSEVHVSTIVEDKKTNSNNVVKRADRIFASFHSNNTSQKSVQQNLSAISGSGESNIDFCEHPFLQQSISQSPVKQVVEKEKLCLNMVPEGLQTTKQKEVYSNFTGENAKQLTCEDSVGEKPIVTSHSRKEDLCTSKSVTKFEITDAKLKHLISKVSNLKMSEVSNTEVSHPTKKPWTLGTVDVSETSNIGISQPQKKPCVVKPVKVPEVTNREISYPLKTVSKCLDLSCMLEHNGESFEIRSKCVEKIRGDFDHPIGVCTNSRGDVIVADTGNNMIKMCCNGQILKKFGTNLKMRRPSAIVVNGRDEIFVKDDNCLYHFDADGQFIKIMGETMVAPYGLGMTKNEELVIVDVHPANARLTIIQPNGAIDTYPYQPLRVQYEYSKCRFLAVCEDEVFTSDLGRSCMYLTSLRGKWKKTIGQKGQRQGQLHQPAGVAVDSAGNWVVADSRNNRVQVFTQNGDFMAQVCFSGETIHRPSGIHLTNDGHLYVINYLESVVKVFKLGP